MNDAHPDTFADEQFYAEVEAEVACRAVNYDEYDWHNTPRSPRAMLVIAVMVVGFWTAVGVGLWLAFN